MLNWDIYQPCINPPESHFQTTPLMIYDFSEQNCRLSTDFLDPVTPGWKKMPLAATALAKAIESVGPKAVPKIEMETHRFSDWNVGFS